MWTKAVEREGSLIPFYERYGFERTGHVVENEVLLRFDLTPGASPNALPRRLQEELGADPLDEDADIRSHLAALGPVTLAELRLILEAPSADRTEILRGLTARPTAEDLATLIAMADTDETVRPRLLQAIRDLGG